MTGIQVQALHDIRVVFWLLPKLHAFTTYIEYNTLLHLQSLTHERRPLVTEVGAATGDAWLTDITPYSCSLLG